MWWDDIIQILKRKQKECRESQRSGIHWNKESLMEETTTVLNVKWDENARKLYEACDPVLFICSGRNITEFPLKGHQVFGRAGSADNPQITVVNRFVSRNHGCFDTDEKKTVFTASSTTNGIQFEGRFLQPDEKVSLRDGDELMIPAAGEDEADCVMLVYADSLMRTRLWRELQQASRDRLTGLYNRESFILWWHQHYMKRDYQEASLFILDVDNFKAINDEKGHNTGDQVLQMVAECLVAAVRYEHQVCRWGGDEFVGILPGSRQRVYNRLKHLAGRIGAEGKKLGCDITVSIGFADIHEVNDVLDISGLVEKADQALYSVKKSGKNSIGSYKK